MLLRFFLLISLPLLLVACQRDEADAPPEDYQTLFPFKGIEKPETNDEIIVRRYTPLTDLPKRIYDPLATHSTVGAKLYDVTLRYGFKEVDGRGEIVAKPEARLKIRYLNEEGMYEMAASYDDSDIDKVLENGKTYTFTYRSHSGMPVYLSTNGIAPRGTMVFISATAQSVDGLVTIPAFGTEQYQNDEGHHNLQHPYCEYIILP